MNLNRNRFRKYMFDLRGQSLPESTVGKGCKTIRSEHDGRSGDMHVPQLN